MGKDKVGLVVLYMDYLRDHIAQPNINICMVIISGNLRMNMTEESVVHNRVVQDTKKSLTRKTKRELSLGKEKTFQISHSLCVYQTHTYNVYVESIRLG